MSVMIGPTLGKQLIDVLGLPERVTWIELRVAIGEVVSLTCEHYIDSEKAPYIVKALQRYELRERRTTNQSIRDWRIAQRSRFDVGHELVLPERALETHR